VSANDRQVGGDHYRRLGGLQPWDVWFAWGLNPFQAAILKYVVRYQKKGGVEDLEKAKHYLEKLIEEERRRAETMRLASKLGALIVKREKRRKQRAKDRRP
jgi:hypothetical protein